ncbi:hypothetical protein DPMN_089204 [Dreissena polymorpha]|uniref:CCAAT-binding factor domain-containing protein n=1 Tax=Dreissena polymorpha TaxID=45954 RepID=A0A9D4KXC9_DREPO|nr:hypothetical protein DPMN_089204 [Dreissena polymorpha]
MDYDPYHRNPAYCHAENACMWELQGLAAHFHPTVALFARQILQVSSLAGPIFEPRSGKTGLNACV